MASATALLRHLILALVSVLALNEGTGVSKEEYFKMKKYLSFINRSYVKSIKTEHGQTFDCVKMYKQPTLDHPLLKNQSIKMRPSFLPQGIDVAASSLKARANFGLPDGGCPPQTIPIRRVHMGDLIRAGSISKFLTKDITHYPDVTIGHKYAVMKAKPGNYLGTEMSLSLWNPQLTDKSQFSLTQFWLISGQGDQLNTIEAGWHVFPQIYNDNRTHLFIYWTADGYSKTGCYNLGCSGFMQVSRELAPGSVLEPVSTVSGDQYELHLYVHKDNMTGNWWLTYGKDYHPIGYWPSNLFTSLDKYAEQVEWGGETYRGILDTYPPMGSGQFADQGYPKSAYIKEIQVVNGDGQKVEPNDRDIVQTYGCYNLLDGGNGIEQDDRYFYYGGPGGMCNS